MQRLIEQVAGDREVFGTIVGGLHRLRLELTLRLADCRALDFRIVDAQGTIHSTGRGLRTE
jgi:hypothetical protein